MKIDHTKCDYFCFIKGRAHSTPFVVNHKR